MLRDWISRSGWFEHRAFTALELIRERIAQGESFAEALAATRAQCVFTTHTPVDAGHDRFSPGLLRHATQQLQPHITPSFSELMALGRVHPENEDEPFCMTVLALKTSRAANAVSELHGQVSRKMWHCLHPDRSVDEVPIGHITNGIHLLGWMKGPVRAFWKHKLGSRWDEEINSPSFWERMQDPDFVSDEELWSLRYWPPSLNAIMNSGRITSRYCSGIGSSAGLIRTAPLGARPGPPRLCPNYVTTPSRSAG